MSVSEPNPNPKPTLTVADWSLEISRARQRLKDATDRLHAAHLAVDEAAEAFAFLNAAFVDRGRQ